MTIQNVEFYFLAKTILVAFLLEQLQPSMDTRSPAESLEGLSNPSIAVLLDTLTCFSRFPCFTVRVLESASKLTTFPLMVLDGHPANREADRNKEHAKDNNNFIIQLVVKG